MENALLLTSFFSPISRPMIMGNEGGCAADDTPRSFPGYYGGCDITPPRKRRQMPGDQFWRKPDMGEKKMWN